MNQLNRPNQPATQMLLVQEEPRGPSQLIEIPVSGTVGKVPLPIIQQLQSNTEQTVIIKALRLIPPGALTNAPTVGGVNAPITEIVKISLVLYSEGWQKGQLIPLSSLCDIFVEGSGMPFRANTVRLDNWQNVDWNKSFLQFSNGTTPVPSYTVILEAEYVRLNTNGAVIIGPG